jgi:16S rRNA (guanine527-N7)-methyltransferase
MIRQVLEKGLAETDLTLSDESIRSFELFAGELKKWNRKVNLTAICKDEDIAVKHLIDALELTRRVHAGEDALDIGSGAGIPAIPLAVVQPAVHVVSVDAVGKKILFQRHVARFLSLNNLEALHARVESLHSSHAGRFDVITSRAFSRLEMFVALAAPLLKNDGRLIAMRGPHVASEFDLVREDIRGMGFEIISVESYSLPMNKGERSLVTLEAFKARI